MSFLVSGTPCVVLFVCLLPACLPACLSLCLFVCLFVVLVVVVVVVAVVVVVVVAAAAAAVGSPFICRSGWIITEVGVRSFICCKSRCFYKLFHHFVRLRQPQPFNASEMIFATGEVLRRPVMQLWVLAPHPPEGCMRLTLRAKMSPFSCINVGAPTLSFNHFILAFTATCSHLPHHQALGQSVGSSRMQKHGYWRHRRNQVSHSIYNDSIGLFLSPLHQQTGF